MRKLLVKGDRTYCSPAFAGLGHLARHARADEAGEAPDGRALDRAAAWLLDREITKTRGDWSWKRPELQPSGWAFQYRNDFYPTSTTPPWWRWRCIAPIPSGTRKA
jgi:squalene-hopene/tetraprenyl-beta-curcumene cyclase